MHALPGQALTDQDFLPTDDDSFRQRYECAWRKVDGVELVFGSKTDAERYFTSFSEVDLRPAIIHQAFRTLGIQKEFADAVAPDKITLTPDEKAQAAMTPEEFDRLQMRLLRLKMQQYHVDQRLERLKSQASNLGYYLFLKPEKFKFPDNTVTDVAPGGIYRQCSRTACWSTTHFRLGWKVWRPTFTANSSHSQTVLDYSKVDVSRDPVADKVDELHRVTDARVTPLDVFVFQHGPAGFVTPDGILLRTVMQQCDRDEAFRRTCVVMLPVYEDSLTGQRALTKYAVFTRPLPGVVPTALPRLIVQESLAYRLAWKESTLGELVSSINLAPGEERTVVVTRTFKQETTTTRSSTSIFDVSRSDTADLATEMENQSRVEAEVSASMQVSATGKASYGMMTAEATASAGVNSSLKSFSQAISKVARKASQALNQKSREEVSSSSTTKTTVDNSDQTTAVIRNINQGRTLNLLFYRLNNRYEGGIFLDDLQFETIPSVEVIAGSGVYESLRFGLHNVRELIDQFRLSRLPFDLESEPDEYLRRVWESIESLLRDEYATPRIAEDAPAKRSQMAAAPTRSARSVGLLSLGQPERPETPPMTAGKAVPSNPGSRAISLESLSQQLAESVLDRDTAIQTSDLILASGGFYLDAVVGALPSTEPYSEEMRTQEVRMRAAEVAVKQAEAEYRRARAGSLPASGNRVTGLYAEPNNKTLRLQLKASLPDGQWDVLVDGVGTRGRLNPESAGTKDLIFTWPRPQDWLCSDDLLRRVALAEAKGAWIGVR